MVILFLNQNLKLTIYFSTDYPSDDLIQKLNFTSELKFMLLLNSPSDKTVPTTATSKTIQQTKDFSDQFSGFRHNVISFSKAVSSGNTTQGQANTRPRPAKHGRVAGGRARARVPSSPPLPRHVAETPVCATFTRVMFPRYGRTTNDEFRSAQVAISIYLRSTELMLQIIVSDSSTTLAMAPSCASPSR